MNPLDLLVEQLWGPGLDHEAADAPRLVVDPTPEVGWRDVETYHVLPDPARARLLVPVAPPPVVRGAVTHYRGLRPLPANAARGLLGVAATVRLPMGRHRVAVRVRTGAAGDVAAARLPLASIAHALGHERLHATFGVRTGANRKATLHLLADDGHTVGYAKLGWNTTADDYVRTETEALADVGGRAAPMRAPAILASFVQGGRPVVVVEPLPADVRGLRGRHQELTPAELYALAPVVRTDTTGATQHFRNLRARLAHLALDPTAVDAVSAAVALADHVATDTQQVPVQARWHGDLTPWNCARQPDGQLWAWDWESSEPDVVAGLDAVHWHFSVRREAGDLDTVTLASCLDRAARHLTAAGWGAPQRGLVAAVYALSVVERAASLAAREGTWDRLWIRPGRLVELLAEGRSLLAGG